MMLTASCGGQDQEIPVSEVVSDTVSDSVIDLSNANCPVMGGPVMEGQYVDWEGYRIHFCCAGCDQTFLADPLRYMRILSDDPSVTEDLSRFRESDTTDSTVTDVSSCENMPVQGCCGG